MEAYGTVEKVKGGFKIRLESGKLLPKVYSTEKAANERISQLKSFRKRDAKAKYERV